MSKVNHVSHSFIENLNGLELYKASYTTQAFSRHWHDGFGIGVIEAGCEVFDYQGEKYYAPPQSIILMNPGIVHTGQAVKQELGWRYRIMYPPPVLIKKVVEQLEKNSTNLPYFPQPVVGDTDSANRLLSLFKALEEPTSLLESESIFFITMAEIIHKHALFRYEARKWSCDNMVAGRIRDYIDHHYVKSISLVELSSVAGKSPFHLLRIFKERFGLPPHAYQIFVRIERSKALLLEGRPLSSIAQEMGFADQSHFTRHFKRMVGITPRAYCL